MTKPGLWICLCAIACCFVFASSSSSIPQRAQTQQPPPKHAISGVPYYRQVTDYSCGDASFEMAAGFYWERWNLSVDQRSIADVLRTNEQEGTLSYDMVRGGHFSSASASVGHQFPRYELRHGWFGSNGVSRLSDRAREIGSSTPNAKGKRRSGASSSEPYFVKELGMASYGYRSMRCWVDELKSVIAADIPVMLLMEYGDVPLDGHYRVGIGYDDSTQTITLLDPWDRDGQPRMIDYTYDVFCGLWNHPEYNGTGYFNPYFASIATPWDVRADAARVSVDSDGGAVYNVSATIAYPCPYPFCGAPNDNGNNSHAFVCQRTTATISLPPGARLVGGGGSADVDIGPFAPGAVTTVSWQIEAKDSAFAGSGMVVIVQAKGLVSASVPPTFGYPKGYRYSDWIGGAAALTVSR